MKTNAKGIVAAAITAALSAGTLAGTALASPVSLGTPGWTDGAGQFLECPDAVHGGRFPYPRAVVDAGEAAPTRHVKDGGVGKLFLIKDGEVGKIEWV